ncbi:hypothetical protein EXS61_02065 [Candidatus Parcubacteria bacterium]|nr:hypothetical protein [Candidatus Parcubacteria bacterium]
MFEQNIQNVQIFLENHPLLAVALMAWSLIWKGFALWKAGRLSHKKWFVFILVLNTLGILDIIYLYFVAKKYTVLSETEEK